MNLKLHPDSAKPISLFRFLRPSAPRPWDRLSEEIDPARPPQRGRVMRRNAPEKAPTPVFASVAAGAVLVVGCLTLTVLVQRSSATNATSVGTHRTSTDLRDNFNAPEVSPDWILPAGSQARGGVAWRIEKGLLRPGSLRIWKDSLGLRDYEFSFSGEIESRALNWVVRASDARNAWVSRIEIAKPGPLPEARLVRWLRIGGRDLEPVVTRLPTSLRRRSTYEVSVKVRGGQFTTVVNGQVADVWTDERLPEGGAGFYSQPGESVLLRHARLTDRPDLKERFLSLIR